MDLIEHVAGIDEQMFQKLATKDQIKGFIGRRKNIPLNIEWRVIEIISLPGLSVFNLVCGSLCRLKLEKTQRINREPGEFSKQYCQVVGYGPQFENTSFGFKSRQEPEGFVKPSRVGLNV
jgi:hypothetical protein